MMIVIIVTSSKAVNLGSCGANKQRDGEKREVVFQDI